MKKIININFQGRVLPIEETSFEILKNYIESLRIYFANEEGRDEIINDIESRIAELFSQRLKDTACITDDDVNAVIAGMGRPSDFEEAEGQPAGNAKENRAGTPPYTSYTTEEPRRLQRSTNDKILGGVCAGLAHYLKIDTAVIRIIFVLFAFLGAGTGILLYLILWIILKENNLPPNISKRLYRSIDDRTIGGVAGGLAAYFNTPVWIIRLIFLLPLVLGIFASTFSSMWGNHFTFRGWGGGMEFSLAVIYVILWIILPQARSASAKLQMKGEKVNLESIRNAVQEDPSAVAPARPSSQGRLGKALGLLFKIFFIIIAGFIALVMISVLMAVLFGGMAGGFGLMPFKDFIFQNSRQEFLAGSSLLLFLGIPAIALLTWLVRRMMGVRSRRHYLGYVFGALWFAGMVSMVILLISVSGYFRTGDSSEEEIELAAPSGQKLHIKVEEEALARYRYQWKHFDNLPLYGAYNDSLFLNTVRFDVIKSEDSVFHVHQIKYASSATIEEARKLSAMIDLSYKQKDSVLSFSKGFFISSREKFRNQKVLVIIGVPVGKKIEFDPSVSRYNWFHIGINGNWNDDFRWKGYRWKAGREYVMTEDGLKKSEELQDTLSLKL